MNQTCAAVSDSGNTGAGWASLFGDFDNRLWLNTADQGPLPLRAALATARALEWKLFPGRVSIGQYRDVPAKLRELLRSVIGAVNGQVVLGNSASYGLSLLARALPWRPRDQVLAVEGDFPANTVPWRGSHPPIDLDLIPAEVWAGNPFAALGQRLKATTRVFCVSWVDSFTGRMLDLSELGSICRSNGTFFVVNVSQGLGNRLFNVSHVPVDAVTCSGSKWLCGPYGTGFSWIGDTMFESMLPVQYYWQTSHGERSLSDKSEANADNASPFFDVFATANFFNHLPWISALNCLMEIGIPAISDHIDTWIRTFSEAFDVRDMEIVRRNDGGSTSALLFISHRDIARNQHIYNHLSSAGIDVALRRGIIRISPHLFNSVESANAVVHALRSAAP